MLRSYFCSGACRSALVLVFFGLMKPGLALSASAGQTSESASSSARLLRNPDSEIELDSAGKARFGQPAALEARDAGTEATEVAGPQVANGGFEVGSTTLDFQQAQNGVPEWNKIGDSIMFIRDGSTEFQGQSAARGNYFLAFGAEGSGVFQSVGGHVVDKWYRLFWHASYSEQKEGVAKLKVSVQATEKFNEEVKAGKLGWYHITYKAPAADVVITFEHAGPAGDRAIFLDAVDIKPAVMWDPSHNHGNNKMVTLQKVTCNGYPSLATCTRGRFLSAGEYDDDGTSSIVETNAASERSVWTSLHKMGATRWAFKSSGLVQASPNTAGHARDGDMWYLHADYTSCEARNWYDKATSTFDIQLNPMGFEVSNVGTECGSLFAIQTFQSSDPLSDNFVPTPNLGR